MDCRIQSRNLFRKVVNLENEDLILCHVDSIPENALKLPSIKRQNVFTRLYNNRTTASEMKERKYQTPLNSQKKIITLPKVNNKFKENLDKDPKSARKITNLINYFNPGMLLQRSLLKESISYEDNFSILCIKKIHLYITFIRFIRPFFN